MTVLEAVNDELEYWTNREHPLREEDANWVVSPKAINGGYCDVFAEGVVAACEENLTKMGWEENGGACPISEWAATRPPPHHTWVTDGEKHYDAEAPSGVWSWKDLPFFDRIELA